jgi:hypothetical protein
MLHAWERFGLDDAQREFTERWDHRRETRRSPETSFRDVLGGRISFIGMVRGVDDVRYRTLRSRFAHLSQRDFSGPGTSPPHSFVRDINVFDAREPEWATDEEAA